MIKTAGIGRKAYPQDEGEISMEEKLKGIISRIFGKYDMRLGEDNKKRMQKVLEFCMEDIRIHPALERELNSNKKLEFFVIQSLIYMIKD